MTEMERLRTDEGMTLIEVLIAMVVMAIGIFAIVAGLSSGILTVQRAAKASSAGALADQQMEGFRGVSFNAIATTVAPADGVYENVSAPYSSPYDTTWKIDTLALASCSQNYCVPKRSPVSATGGSYRIDTYVRWQCASTGATLTVGAPGSPPTCSGGVASRAVKQVSIVVRNASDVTKTLFRETSNFDSLTG